MSSAKSNNPRPPGEAETSETDATSNTRMERPIPPGVPREIDGYRLLHVIGTGGMATVYAALQERPRRTVALKVMKAEIDDPVAVRRFRREVEILGKLRHQYIAQVYDAGTYNDGHHERPYFAMEYVADARTIFEYAAMENLSIRDRVKLFVHVCAAIEHGNRNRIVHRDLKPSNILVDRRGRPKIIDFGVARVTELQVGVDTMNTEMGRLVGTIQYMSPEQVSAVESDLDGRCDVYALGVLLCKLLTGKPPYELEGLPVYEAARVIREDQPDRPSAFNAQLRGDLDTIILKALEKDAARRYRSAGEFGRDLMRWLENKPIHARPAAMSYRARLFFARHRAAVLSTILSTIVISVSAGVVLFVITNETSRQRDLQDQLDRLMKERADAQNEMIEEAAARRDEQTREEERNRPLPPRGFIESPAGTVYAMAFMSDQPARLATGTAEHDVVTWNIVEEEVTTRFTEHDTSITHIAAAGGLIASAAHDESIAINNSASGNFVARVPVRCGTVRALEMSDDIEMLAWSCDDLAVHVRDIGVGSESRLLRSSRGQLQCVAFSSDGNVLAAGSEQGSVFIWDPRTGELLTRLDDLQSPAIGVTFNATGDRVIAVSEDGSMAMWQLESIADAGDGTLQGRVLAKTDATEDGATRFAADAGRLFIAVASGQTIRRYDLRDASESFVPLGEPISLPMNVESMAIRIDGRMIVASHEGGRMTIEHVRSE